MNVNKKLIFDILMVIGNLLLLAIVFIMFNGCAEKTLIEREQVKKVELNLKSPEPIEMKDVSFYVIKKENSDSVFKDLEKKEKENVLFGITPKDYENMSLNIAKIKKYMIEQQNIIDSYKKYYESEVK